MKTVYIIPTMETSWGIEDKYDIMSKNNLILHKNIPQCLLENIVKENKYEVIGGEKYL